MQLSLVCIHELIVIHLCGSMNSELQTIYISCVLSYHNQLFTTGYYNLVSLIFGTTIPTSFNILMKYFLHLCNIVRVHKYILYVMCHDIFSSALLLLEWFRQIW